MKKTLLLAAAAILALQAVPAFAEEGGDKKGHRGPEKMFEKFDTDKNGMISAQESADAAKKKFDETDANKDGNLTKEEVVKHHEAKRAEWKAKREAMKAGESKTEAKPADKPAEAPKAE